MKNKAKILIVDDIAENIQVLATILNEYQVIFATNGTDGIKMVREHTPDIIILDIMMPDISGYDVCRILHSDSNTKDIPVIFVTAIHEDESESIGLEVGAVDYVTKPISPRVIKARIKNHLELKFAKNQLEELNKNLEIKIQKEIDNRLVTEKILMQQSKMAAMGEMIGAIAHQWRQPLNNIAVILQDFSDAYKYDELDDVYIEQSISKGMKYINDMSQMIEDFKNFFKPTRIKKQFYVKDVIQKAIYILDSQLKINNISINFVPNNLIITGICNEFIQVIIYLIQNAKDSILSKTKETKDLKNYIGIIDISIVDRTIIIRDNGIGIDKSLIDSIFNPYFTTKPDGNGLGLYISKMIVEEHLNGTIKMSLIDNGAEFRIEL
jgi:CheY-like chemotaxis protein